jgi:hypothetical protein
MPWRTGPDWRGWPGCGAARGTCAMSGPRPAPATRGRAAAVEVYLHRLRREIAAMAAAMNGLDALVFTGGIGEHDPAVRAGAAAGLEFLGVAVEEARNQAAVGDADISAAGAAVRTLRITARADAETARQARGVLRRGPARSDQPAVLAGAGVPADDHDRTRRVVDAVLADQAEQHLGETAEPAAADYQQLRDPGGLRLVDSHHNARPRTLLAGHLGLLKAGRTSSPSEHCSAQRSSAGRSASGA